MADDLFADLLPASRYGDERAARGGRVRAEAPAQRPVRGSPEPRRLGGTQGGGSQGGGTPERHYRAARRLALGMPQLPNESARMAKGRQVCAQIRAMLDAQAQLAGPGSR